MNVHSQEVKDDLQKRLRRIEGQVRGIQRMLEDALSEEILAGTIRLGEEIRVSAGEGKLKFTSAAGQEAAVKEEVPYGG